METSEINFSPVLIRTREQKSGKKTIYLEINFHGRRNRESLGLYLLPGNDRKTKLRNKETLRAAEEIKSKRILELQADEYDFDSKKAGHTVVLDWLEDQREYYHEHGNGNYSKTIKSLIKHLGIFAKNGMTMRDITPNFLRRFLDYLNGDINSHSGGKLSHETIYTYFTVFCILMNKAVRLDLIPKNPFHKLGKAERPQRRTKKREYLTLEEVKKLANTECDVWQVKFAFLFCCFTGLRYIDVSRLKWKHIVKTNEGEWQMEIVQQKTKEPVYIPLSKNALRWLPEQGINGRENYVFQFRDRSMIYEYLDKWAKRAGIMKHVTFHMSRHTCATMLLYYGADLYTVSKILGHTSIKTTQIYAQVVDDMKAKAVNSVPELGI